MTGAQLERHLLHLRWIASNAADRWERAFAQNILKLSRRRDWRPTRKQAETMERLVADMFPPQLMEAAT